MDDETSVVDLPATRVTGLYLAAFLGTGALYLILHYFWGRYVLMNFTQLKGHGFVGAGLGRVWFIFAWAIVGTLIISAIERPVSSLARSVQLIKGWWLSINAGVFEELIYRWLVFFSAMIVLPFFNFITFGLTKWLYMHALVPLANWATFHALAPQLHSNVSWTVGAAIVSASADFRDAHSYQGVFGKVNAWFGGMLLFWLMFHYGLMTAIVAHVLYDGIIFSLRAVLSDRPLAAFIRRRR